MTSDQEILLYSVRVEEINVPKDQEQSCTMFSPVLAPRPFGVSLRQAIVYPQAFQLAGGKTILVRSTRAQGYGFDVI